MGSLRELKRECFGERLNTFLKESQRIVNKNHEKYKHLTPPTLRLEEGKRYIRIVSDDGPHHISAWGFIDKTNGDVLKAASWKAPAKHARGNLFDEWNGLKYITPYGPAYLR